MDKHIKLVATVFANNEDHHQHVELRSPELSLSAMLAWLKARGFTQSSRNWNNVFHDWYHPEPGANRWASVTIAKPW